MNEPLTLMNIRVMELPNALKRILPPQAYTEIKGTRKKGMTDTKPHYLRQRLTEIFGVCGHGWWVEIVSLESQYDEGHRAEPVVKTTEVTKKFVDEKWVGDTSKETSWQAQDKTEKPGSPWTSVAQVRFFYRYKVGDEVFVSEAVVGTGGISMDRKDFSERGAVTNAIGDALKLMGWQEGLYFNRFDHKTAAEKYNRQQEAMMEWREQGKHIPGDPIE